MALCTGGKLRSIGNDRGEHIGYMLCCPGCERHHAVYTEAAAKPAPVWGFNGNVERPTFTPSLLVRWKEDDVQKVCHSFITDGRVQFLTDCTHALAGQTVDIPQWPDREFEDNHPGEANGA